MKIVLANLASPENPGDQAIFKGALKLLKFLHPGAGFTVATRGYSERQVYEQMGCSVVPGYPDVECLASDSKWEKIRNIPKALSNPTPLKQAIRECDYVFLMGGAYFYSYKKWMPGLMYLSHFSSIRWAKKFKKPVIFLPQSYGPFSSLVSGALFRWGLKQSTAVFYRENISGDFLKKYKFLKGRAAFMPDLALNLEPQDLVSMPKPFASKRIIGITIRAWETEGYSQNDYIEALSDALSSFHKEEAFRVRVIVQVQDAKKGEGDEWISKEFAKLLHSKIGEENVEFYTEKPFFNLSDLCSLYAECDLLIGMRLHSVLLSYLVGTPALVVGYQHKARGILKDTDLEDLFIGDFEAVTKELILSSIRQVWPRREYWVKRIEERLLAAREKIITVAQETMNLKES